MEIFLNGRKNMVYVKIPQKGGTHWVHWKKMPMGLANFSLFKLYLKRIAVILNTLHIYTIDQITEKIKTRETHLQRQLAIKKTKQTEIKMLVAKIDDEILQIIRKNPTLNTFDLEEQLISHALHKLPKTPHDPDRMFLHEHVDPVEKNLRKSGMTEIQAEEEAMKSSKVSNHSWVKRMSKIN